MRRTGDASWSERSWKNSTKFFDCWCKQVCFRVNSHSRHLSEGFFFTPITVQLEEGARSLIFSMLSWTLKGTCTNIHGEVLWTLQAETLECTDIQNSHQNLLVFHRWGVTDSLDIWDSQQGVEPPQQAVFLSFFDLFFCWIFNSMVKTVNGTFYLNLFRGFSVFKGFFVFEVWLWLRR